MILVWVQNILWCDNTHYAHNHLIKLKQRPTTKITGLSALDTEASLLLYMPLLPPCTLEPLLPLPLLPLLPPCTLERLWFGFSAGSKSLTIVHAHPSHFITTSELILEDFRESQANFASETLIFLSTAEHEMTIKLNNNIWTLDAFPRILHLHHSECCNSTPLWNIWMNVSFPLNTLHSNARPGCLHWPWPRN